MKNILFKEIEKIVLIFAIPMAIFLLVFFNERPQISIAFIIGAVLGVFRLKTLFAYIGNLLSNDEIHNNGFNMLKYMLSLFVSLGTMGFALYKSLAVGLSIVFGLVLVPITIMIYSIYQGISLYKKKM